MEVTPKLKRIHVAVRPIVAKALQTRPEDRYQTAHEMAEDLRTARATLEPEHDPALLAAMVSRAVKRRDRVEGTSDVKKSSAARPSTAARQKRAKSVMRKPRPDESAAQQPPARPPLPELLPWDSARTFTLLAALITLLGLCYTFIPLGV